LEYAGLVDKPQPPYGQADQTGNTVAPGRGAAAAGKSPADACHEDPYGDYAADASSDDELDAADEGHLREEC
jgi:hypothetical protein